MNPPRPLPSTSPLPGIRPGGRLHGSAAGSWLAALVFVAVPFVAANILAKLVMDDPGLRGLRNLIKSLVLVAAYWAYVHWCERRRARELSTAGALSEFLAGLLLGGLLFSAVIGVLAALGVYSLDAAGSAGGPTRLTGGVFEAEASIVSVVLCLATAAVLLTLARRHGRFTTRASS